MHGFANNKISLPRQKIALTLATVLVLTGTAQADIFSDMATTLREDFAAPELSSNAALIDQREGSANTASIHQSQDADSTGHYAEINQAGMFNQATMVQTGDSNRVKIEQIGASNLIELDQSGEENLFESSQLGDDNIIVASQSGLSSTTLTEVGNSNSISADLSSPGVNVNITIVGDGMSVSVQ